MLEGMPLARFQLAADPTNGVALVVNDQAVDGVRSVQFLAAPGEVPQLVVTQHAEASELVGEGVVHVQHGASNAREYLLEWLDALDGAELERQALDRQGWGSGGLGTEILDVLKELARSITE